MTFDYPLTEYQYLRVGGTVDSSQLLTNSLGSALQAQQVGATERPAVPAARTRRYDQQRVRVLRNQLQSGGGPGRLGLGHP